MPQSIVDADTWTVTVECAADGDPVNGASQVLLAQDLADRTRFVHERTLGPPAGTGLWHQTPLADYGSNQVSGFITDSMINAWQQSGTGGLADFYSAPLRVPPAGKIVEVEVLLVGNGAGGGPHVSVPAVKPRLSLYRNDYDTTGSNFQLVAQITDPSVTIAAYDAKHWVTLTGLSEVIGDSGSWWVEITGEGGAGAIALALQINTLRARVEP